MKVKLLVIVLLIVAGIAALALSAGTEVARQQEYNQALTAARRYADREIPYMAVQYYLKAIGMKNDDEEVYREYLAQAKKLGRDYYKTAKENYIPSFPNSPQAYEDICTEQYESQDYSKAAATAKEAGHRGIATEKVKEIYFDSFYRYRYINTGMTVAESFVGYYARIAYGTLYGIMDYTGKFTIAPKYLDISELVGSTLAVKDDQECYIINLEGYKVARTSAPVDSMSFLSAGHILISKSGRWGYTDTTLTIPEQLPYEAATNYSYGVAAVKQNGRWALIGRDDQPITDYVFEDVILSESNCCISAGVIFAKQNGKYFMFNEKGERLNDQGFDNACLFEDADSLAAVCVDGKWGFIDNSGNMVIKPTYSEARSFSIGLAPVSDNGMWGYINTSGEYRISPTFEDAKPFAASGIAAVKENEVWNYIQLLGYYNE